MSSHVMNRLKLEGDIEKIDEVLRSVQKANVGFGSLNFNKIVPMPKELDIESGSRTHCGLAAYKKYLRQSKGDSPEQEKLFLGSHPEVDEETWALGKQAYRNKQVFGFPTWYEWVKENWGTRCSPLNEAKPELIGNARLLSFQTVWFMPLPVILKLSEMLPEAKLSILYASEEIGHNCGELVIRNGEVKSAYVPKWSKESVEFAASVWGESPESFHYRLNESGTEYEFFDEDEDILDDFSLDSFDSHEPSGDEPTLKM